MKANATYKRAVFLSEDPEQIETAKNYMVELLEFVPPTKVNTSDLDLKWSTAPNEPPRVCVDCGCGVGFRHGYVQVHRQVGARVQMLLLCARHYAQREECAK